MPSEHVFLRASTEFSILTQNTETALRELDFEFFQNRGRELIEYEITKPVYFRVLVEKRKDPEVGNFLIPSIKTAKGSTLDIWFDEDESSGSKESARQFVQHLLQSLPERPWEGLKFRESGKEKKKWMEFTSN